MVIPPLQKTLQRYLDTVRPLVSDEEFAETQRKVADFLEDPAQGPALDEQLHILASQSHTSWLEGFWDTMYLEWRDPLPVHMNPWYV